MLSNNRISFVKSLQQKKYRAEHGLFVAEGDKLVREYLQSTLEIEAVYASTDWLQRNGILIKSHTDSAGATEKDLSRMSSLVTAPEVLAVVRIPEYTIKTEECSRGLFLVLDGIRDPGNLGTIIRTADWFGVNRIIVSEDTAEPWNPKVVQSSMGSLTRVKIVTRNLEEFFAEAKHPNVYGTFMEGESVYKSDLQTNGFIVIGNESNGIRESLFPFITKKISVPAYNSGVNRPESLNAAIAAALVLGEFRRR
jgi:TrmH family RNA methyltransferase